LDIFRGATAPFLLTLLLTVVGWLFDRSIQRFEDVAFLGYAAQVDRQQVPSLSINLTNQSATATFTEIHVFVRCPANHDCLKPFPAGGYISYSSASPVSIAVNPQLNTYSSVNESIIDFLPTGAEIKFTYLLKSISETPNITFDFPKMHDKKVAVFEGISAPAFVVAHYYKFLFGAMFIIFSAVIVYFMWLVWTYFSQKEGGKDGSDPIIYYLVHSINSVSSEPTVSDPGS
jgi:hypothetical protein